jgi:hypothetical protein
LFVFVFVSVKKYYYQPQEAKRKVFCACEVQTRMLRGLYHSNTSRVCVETKELSAEMLQTLPAVKTSIRFATDKDKNMILFVTM